METSLVEKSTSNPMEKMRVRMAQEGYDHLDEDKANGTHQPFTTIITFVYY